MAHARGLVRRGVLSLIASAAVLPNVHVRTAGAAGTLRIGVWKHWMPRANAVMRRQVNAWADRNAVAVSLDFIPLSGSRLQIIQAAEAEARNGHDLLPFYNWNVQRYADLLEPMDDIVAELTRQYGSYNAMHAYLAQASGHWRALPSSTGTSNLNCVGRISLLRQCAGIDVRDWYPARPAAASAAAEWTYDRFLKAAAACARAGFPFGLGLGQTSDSVNAAGALFAAFGAELVNAASAITVDSDAVHAVLDYGRQLGAYLPADCTSYDDESNNRALISGRSALIANPPSAWAVACQSAPHIAADCWHFPWPAGAKGRYCPYNYCFFGVWSFGSNKTAAKALARYLQERRQVEERDDAADGYDLPPFPSMSDFPVWRRVAPPAGTIYNYPLRPWHKAEQNIAAYPAPPAIAMQIYLRATQPTMLAMVREGRSNQQVIAWARRELESFMS